MKYNFFKYGRKYATAIQWLTFMVVGFVFFSSQASSNAMAGEITLLTPTSGSVILSRQNTTNLIIRLSDFNDTADLKISSKKADLAPFGTWEKNGLYYAHFRIPLKKGNNSFLISKNDLPIRLKFKPLRSMLSLKTDAPGVFLFHRQHDLQTECNLCHDNQIPPKTDGPYKGAESYSPECFSCHKTLIAESPNKHDPSTRLLCKSCHPIEEGQGAVSFPKGRMDQLCIRCHTKGQKWLAQKHIHGPVGTGDCTVCHNPHGDQYPFQLWAEPSISLCVSCHTDKQKLNTERSDDYYAHGILKGSGCLACHSPHASENRFQLYRPINDLCTGCHINIDTTNRGHPVKKHPVQGRKDPRRPNRDLSCTSCHNPHGSMFKFLLIGDILGGHVCAKCHRDGRRKNKVIQ